ncbi:MAG: hypothetical protein IKO47_08170 [Ruminococcus sp.]|nr:hypothetical protein [Ruminococcus sp.]
MKQMIKDYQKGVDMLRNRLDELSALRKRLGEAEIAELDLDRRIFLLKKESSEAEETIAYLSSVMRRRGLSVET